MFFSFTQWLFPSLIGENPAAFKLAKSVNPPASTLLGAGSQLFCFACLFFCWHDLERCIAYLGHALPTNESLVESRSGALDGVCNRCVGHALGGASSDGD
ncbi:MAG: hypothetical protein IPI82_05390 [Candidatus Microthrix sp.]|nr:hypothetical protein [Candidatus Microthrix sp.]MBK7321884.1 hypothetical protein [Candidatus Microthrix sp.]